MHYKNDKLPGTVKKGSFWWRDVLKLLPQFKQMASVKMNSGITCHFWKDSWESQPLQTQYPQAFSFARNKNITARKAFRFNDIAAMFNLPVSQVAYEQMASIQQKMEVLQLDDRTKDVWTYQGGASSFKPGNAYKRLLGHQQSEPALNWIWKSACQPKHKVFAWLLLKDRLSTRNILRRKQMNIASFNCEFCLQAIEETVDHLFWHCAFAQQCWGSIGIQTVQGEGTVRNIQAIKDQLHSQFFMIAIILLCWTIWKARNEMIFNNNQFSIQECKELFFKELRLVSFRVKQSLSAPFDLWIQNL